MARKGLFKRGSIWWIRYAGIDGRIVRKSSKTANFKQAETMLHNEKESVKKGLMPDAVKIENHSFKELAEKYKAWVKGRQASAQFKCYIIDKLVDRYGIIPLRRFCTDLVEQLQTDLMEKGFKDKDPKPCTHAYINRVINIFKHMFTKAVEWEMVEADIAKRVQRVKMFKEDTRLRFLSIEEAKGLVSVCDEHLKPIVVVALNTGMRKGEILGLKWANVDLQHRFILLDKTKNGERREIPINDTLMAVFHSLGRRVDVPYVFYDPIRLKPYQDVKRSFATALKRANISDFHFHDLRHTFASQAVMAGVDLTAVKELLGHKNIKMTLRYAHLAPAHKRKAVDVMGKLLSNPTQTDTVLANCTKTDTQNKKELAYVS